MTKCVIVDIDGTVANVEHRRRFFPDGKFNWSAFESPDLMKKDPPNGHIPDVVRALQRDFVIVYVSGRKNKNRDLTIKWLRDNDLWFFPHVLRMRQDEDNRADHIIKSEILQDLISEGFEPILAIDDRQQVVDMWRAHGIQCMQVDKGDF